MKRALAFALLLAVFAPPAALIASACATSPCCAGGEDRFAAPMNCCAPTICAAPSPARQPKSGDPLPVPTVVAADLEIASDDVSDVAVFTFDTEESAPPPTRVRLALIATLLI
ncbi:MAG TPA: hypothetical protein VFM36_00975 [Thermoanaerobaculia bacterium]|nr:hypothetical protein [Thermoanaerobaculia bacterium]